MRVLMLPTLKHFRSEESGIKRVVENYVKYGPQFGITYVDEGESYDLKVSHAGTNIDDIDVAHLHGLYWSADVPCNSWEWKANANVIEAARQARVITVPSEWVAKSIRRDMRRNPAIIGHGIDWEDWQHDRPLGGYVLWNKNRTGDVCDPAAVGVLAHAYPKVKFVTTFAPQRKRHNIEEISVIPHDQMQLLVQGAGVYLSTTKETFGIGTLEAMAAGVPVLGYAHGGNLELIQHGITGYLAEPGDNEDLIDGLAYCIKYRDTLGANGRERAREFTWEAVMEKVAGVYNEALRDEPATAAIIIPSYMYGDKVERAVRSAMQQSYAELTDIVVVDDGSDDGGLTQEVVSNLSQEDARVRYIRQQNQGVAMARNTGIDSVDTKYVSCLDADDAMEAAFVERCVRALERDNSLGLAYTRIRHVLPNGQTGTSPWPNEWDFDDQLQRKNQVPTCNVFRRKVWEQLGGYKSRYCPIGAGSEDAEFWTRIGAYGWKCEMVTAEPLFIYSLGSGRVSGSKDYNEPDWLAWHPWAFDGKHPFASYATPKKWSHPVRQYDEPAVSVIIPVGPGHDKSLEDALDSVEAQTERKWECIVVWDRDDSPPERYTKAYPFVNWLYTGKNQGAGAARNMGAKEANAPFLLFLDADDYLVPKTLEVMLDEWAREEAVIYSDYIGKAFIADPEGLSPKLQQKILWRMDDGLTALYYEASDYDPEKAQRQPVGDPKKVYTWNLITSLVPKLWHDEIGGFDETMPSWEDVDYWWRIAKRGHCFRRVEEALVVYHFYTGGRRDLGLEKHQELFGYLREKHEREEIVGCPGCGSRSRGVRPPSVSKAATSNAPLLALQDDDFKKCVYNHPNKGQHTVIGAAVFRDRMDDIHMVRDRNNQGWHIHYGFRGGGDTFLVHVEDIKLAPHIYLPQEVAPRAPQKERTPTPAPMSIKADAVVEEDDDEGLPPPPKRIELDDLIAGIQSADTGLEELDQEIAVRAGNGRFDAQKLPGVTAKAAQHMEGMTIEDILDMGIEGLEEIPYVGPQRAKSIYNAALEMAGAG